MNKGNHVIAPPLLNPIEFDGIRKPETEFRKLHLSFKDPKGFKKPLGSASAEEQEVGR